MENSTAFVMEKQNTATCGIFTKDIVHVVLALCIVGKVPLGIAIHAKPVSVRAHRYLVVLGT
jgi:hypothetical protein